MRSALLWLWSRLTAPTQRRPEDYHEHRIASTVNTALDGPAGGPAHEAMLGEAAALAADEVLHGGPVAANTPLGYLSQALGHYVVLLRVYDDSPGAWRRRVRRPRSRQLRENRGGYEATNGLIIAEPSNGSPQRGQGP